MIGARRNDLSRTMTRGIGAHCCIFVTARQFDGPAGLQLMGQVHPRRGQPVSSVRHGLAWPCEDYTLVAMKDAECASRVQGSASSTANPEEVSSSTSSL